MCEFQVSELLRSTPKYVSHGMLFPEAQYYSMCMYEYAVVLRVWNVKQNIFSIKIHLPLILPLYESI